jgi:hypothetical protein
MVWLHRSPIPGGGGGNFLVQMISTCLRIMLLSSHLAGRSILKVPKCEIFDFLDSHDFYFAFLGMTWGLNYECTILIFGWGPGDVQFLMRMLSARISSLRVCSVHANARAQLIAQHVLN